MCCLHTCTDFDDESTRLVGTLTELGVARWGLSCYFTGRFSCQVACTWCALPNADAWVASNMHSPPLHQSQRCTVAWPPAWIELGKVAWIGAACLEGGVRSNCWQGFNTWEVTRIKVSHLPHLLQLNHIPSGRLSQVQKGITFSAFWPIEVKKIYWVHLMIINV